MKYFGIRFAFAATISSAVLGLLLSGHQAAANRAEPSEPQIGYIVYAEE